MRGQERMGPRLVRSAFFLAVLTALVWSGFSMIAPSSPSSPQWVIKPIPTLPTETAPFLLAEEEDSRIAAQFPMDSSSVRPTEQELNQPCVSPKVVEQDETASVAVEDFALAVVSRAECASVNCRKIAQGGAYESRKVEENEFFSSSQVEGREVNKRPQPRFALHVESFKDVELAKKRAEHLRGVGLETFLLQVALHGKGTWYRVLLGKFTERTEAEAARSRIQKENGLKGIRVVSLQGGKP